MAGPTTQTIPVGRDNIGINFLGPYTAGQSVLITTSKAATTGYAALDGANLQIKVDKLAEYTSSNGIRLANNVKWTGTNFTITSATSDTGFTAVCGGSTNTDGHGAKFLAYGFGHATLAGIAFVVGDGGPVRIQTVDASHDIDFQPGQNTMWSVTGSNGDLTGDASNGGHINIQRAGKGFYAPQSPALAAAGSDQGSATAITRLVNQFTSGSGGGRMMAASAGFFPVFLTNVSGSPISIYPSTGDSFEDQAANAPVTLSNRTGMICWSVTNDVWGYVVSA